MKKNIIFLCLIMIMVCFPLFNIKENNYFAHATGEVVSTPISSAEDLSNISLDGNYHLTNDIVLTDISFKPIGTVSQPNGNNDSQEISSVQALTSNAFTGSFDGKGYTISGLRLDTMSGYSNLGLFAKLDNANIKNLKIQVNYLNFSNNLINTSAVYIGAIAGQSNSSNIEQCGVEYVIDNQNYNVDNLQFSISTKNSFYFGGLVGDITGGITKNCYAKTVLDKAYKDMTQGVNVAIGGLAGSFSNSKFYNCYAQSTFNLLTSQTNNQISVNVGGIAGVVEGANSIMISNYASINLNSSNQYNFGSLIGKIDNSLPPAQNNLNYMYGCGKYIYGTMPQSLNLIGQANNYNITENTLEKLDENDYSIFEDNSKFSSDYYWDYNNIWSKVGGNFPSLQIFKTYSISLNTTPSVDYGVLTPSENVATIEYVDLEDPNNLRHNDEVKIKITIAENYSKYFKLDNILVANVIVYDAENIYENNSMFKVTSPIQDELNPANNTNYYLVEYKVTDRTEGQVSFSLEKINYSLEIFTENSSMGKVRNQFSSVPTDSFTQNISYGNTYNFYAVADSSNFAFLNWAFIFDDEEQNTLVENSMSNFTFVFGKESLDQQNFNNFIFSGGKLMAQWTSNICNVNIETRLKTGEPSNGCEITEQVSKVVQDLFVFAKGSQINLIANVKEGYEFDGWYDNSGKLLSNSKELVYNLDAESEQMTLVVKLVKLERQINLTWLWITLGATGGVVLIALAVFLIVRKAKNSAYKNYY